MDFFKFNPTGAATTLEGGELINGYSRSTWIERYYGPGEFIFEAPLSSGLSEVLLPGTLISHLNTLEVMMVETHEINDDFKMDPVIKISGGSLSGILRDRVAGINQMRTSSTLAPYVIPSGNLWDQIVTLINDHISEADVVDPDDALIDVIGSTNVASGVTTPIERTIDRGTVLDNVAKLLVLEDLGIRTVRANSFYGAQPDTHIQVYRGEDRSADVMFSWRNGDIQSAAYLYTTKNLKNSAVVMGQYVVVVVDIGDANLERRIMSVDATDIDGTLGGVPTGTTLTDVETAMQTRGLQALSNQNRMTINQSDISSTAKNRYRVDYGMGDLITLDGNFGQTGVMRVIEFAEIEDENGYSGHPTLSVPLTLE